MMFQEVQEAGGNAFHGGGQEISLFMIETISSP
jgi:hypothetical protein